MSKKHTVKANQNRPSLSAAKSDLTRKELIQILAAAKVPAKPNCIRPVIRLAGLNLSGMDFHGMNLTAIDFSNSILHGCRFAHAKVWACDFYKTDLRDSDWRDAKVSADFVDAQSNFNQADLRGSNWHGVDASENEFENANFSGADLRDANFSGCDFYDAILTDAQLAGSEWKGAATSGTSIDHLIYPPSR